MKLILSLGIGISCFVSLGNAQDGGGTPPGSSAVYSIQGNVMYNRAQHEKELERAALQARQSKELKRAMAAQSMHARPSIPRTADEFLAANKPPPAPPSDTPRPPVKTRRDYVPPFEGASEGAPPGVSQSAAPLSTPAMPKKEGGLFQFFKSKKKNDPALLEPAGASEYQNSYTPEGIEAANQPAAADAPPMTDPSLDSAAARESAINEATVNLDLPAGGTGKEKSGFLGKLFGKKKSDVPTHLPAPDSPEVTSEPAGAPSEAPAPPVATNTSNEIPDPVAFNEEPPPAPPKPAPIFNRRSGGGDASGSPATIASEGAASVNGVKVKLYKGTNVRVLDSSGGTARIQLQDGRIGTIPSSHLSR